MAQRSKSFFWRTEQAAIRSEKVKEAKVKAVTTARKTWETVVQASASKMSSQATVSSVASMDPVQLKSFSEQEERLFCFRCGGQGIDCDVCYEGIIILWEKQDLKYKPLSFPLPMEIADYELTYLSEIVRGNLHLYGSKAVAATISHKWGIKIVSLVHTVSFHFVVFDDVAHLFGKLNKKFSNMEAATFEYSCLESLSQINALGRMPGLKKLIIKSEGNPVLKLSFWKQYVIYRLSSTIEQINGSMVTELERNQAETLFGGLGFSASLMLPKYRLHSLLNNPRAKQLFFNEQDGASSSLQKKPDIKLAEEIVKSMMTYDPVFKSPSPETKQKARNIVEKNIRCVDEIMKKRLLFKKSWPPMFKGIVTEALEDYKDIDQYMKQEWKNMIDKYNSQKKC